MREVLFNSFEQKLNELLGEEKKFKSEELINIIVDSASVMAIELRVQPVNYNYERHKQIIFYCKAELLNRLKNFL